MNMICSCGRAGIFWRNLGQLNEHTYCPNCHRTNCQQMEEIGEIEEAKDDQEKV